MANKSVTPKRDRSKRKRIQLQVDDVNLPMPPYELAASNLLPEKTEMPDPDFRGGMDEAEFERFFDEHFPPGDERFAELRRWVVAGPNLRPAGPYSKLDNYLIILINRQRWWAAARINRLVAAYTNTDVGPLRICDWCRKLFIAGRNNQDHCTKKCGAALRQKRKRDKRKQYELQRELNISTRNEQQRKLKKRAR
jgi:hypothetical protein